MLLFIAAVAAAAIHLARRPTIADGRVMEVDLLAQLRDQGVIGLRCDRAIPIRRDGATFTCVATFDDGSRQIAADETILQAFHFKKRPVAAQFFEQHAAHS